jgi:hypothetical protein
MYVKCKIWSNILYSYFFLHTCFTHNDKTWFNRNKILSVAQIHHIFLICQSIGVMNPLFKYYLIHLNTLITFPESSQWTPPFSPFLFSKFSFPTVILPKHFYHFPNKRDIVSGPLPLFSLCIERSPNACI